MKKSASALLGLACLVMTGCSTAPVVLNYSPSSTMSVSGTEKVGTFDYTPAKGGKIKPNQIRNTAMGNIILEKNIHEYFETALYTESRAVGIDVRGARPEVHGTINDFLVDDLGYSVDWTLDVSYVVDVPGSDKVCYSQTKKTQKHTAKFVNAFGTLNEVMKLNIEELFKDPAYQACIASA
jgi:uncharacterized lipoprotein